MKRMMKGYLSGQLRKEQLLSAGHEEQEKAGFAEVRF